MSIQDRLNARAVREEQERIRKNLEVELQNRTLTPEQEEQFLIIQERQRQQTYNSNPYGENTYGKNPYGENPY